MKEKYDEVFRNVFNVEQEQLGEQFTFKDVDQWTSITHLNLIMRLEDVFDVAFDTEDIVHFESYENGLKILERYGIKF